MHITTNDISLIRFDLPIVEGSAPNEPKCNTHIHIRNTCTLDRCKQKRKKEEQKKKNLETIFGGEEGGRAGAGGWGWERKVRNSLFLYASVIKKKKKDKLGHDRLENALHDRTERPYIRWPFTVDPQKTITAQSILPVLLFNALDPRRRCLRNATTSVVYRAYSIHSLVDPRDHRSFRTRITRDSTTHKPSFSFLGIARLSSMHTVYKR